MVAIAKRKLEVHLNMGHDIVTAQQMKDGLDANGGLMGTMVAIVQPNARTRREVKTMKNISMFSNFLYEGDGLVRVNRAYGVGRGKLISIEGADHFVPLNPREDVGFTATEKSHDLIFVQRPHNNAIVRLCPQPGCIGVYTPEEEKNHKHEYKVLNEDELKGMDKSKAVWGEELLGEGSGLHGKSTYKVSIYITMLLIEIMNGISANV